MNELNDAHFHDDNLLSTLLSAGTDMTATSLPLLTTHTHTHQTFTGVALWRVKLFT